MSSTTPADMACTSDDQQQEVVFKVPKMKRRGNRFRGRQKDEEERHEETTEADEDIESAKARAVLELQRTRKRRHGLTVEQLAAEIPGEHSTESTQRPKATPSDDPFKLASGGVVDVKSLKASDWDRVDVEKQIKSNFSREANLRDEDEEMRRFVEEELAKRTGREVAEQQLQGGDGAGDAAAGGLYDLPERLKVASIWPDRSRPQAVYIQHTDNFEELSTFIDECEKRYNLDLIRISAPIKDAIAALKQQRPDIQAVFMGTRRTDPRAATLSHFAPTDPSWPPLMRVNPVLDWSYSHVWRALLQLQIPYCPMYDAGYTSLGARSTTKPNDALKYVDSAGEIQYHPAHMLKDFHLERSGRL